LEQHARAATQQFETAARQQGYVRIESRVSSADQISAITLNARYADLVVIGQKNPADSVLSGSLVNPGNVVLACPRPVLVIPYIGAPAGFGNHILIAWNGSRESCRAVTDALPLLKLAGRVTVMAVDPRISNSAHGAAPGADLAKFLASHDVKVTAQPDYSDVDDAGVELLSRAADLGADLLVMGAYGHTRTREWVLGGVTRTILASMTIPVLMSH
jgi:nucleotide-binding universal stress UspA family protein